jgi:pimeloyl-ACP methyl ester carboxylesterase
MPIAHVNDIDLYYEVHGEGPNLVLIEGLGYHTWMWYRQIPEFSGKFRTLIYDNRGVGLSDKPPGPYSHEQNADDLAALLNHLEWERTHVLGVSMGGFIAQTFALSYPGSVDRLVLVATGFGGPNMVPIPMEAAQALLPRPDLPEEEQIRLAMPIAFGDRSWAEQHPEEFDRIVAWRLEQMQPPEARMAQIMAGVAFNVENRLGEIRAPTLVIAGSEDNVVPPGNADLLAQSIPNARLDIIPGAGHLAFIEQPERFNRDVIDFLLNERREADGGPDGT